MFIIVKSKLVESVLPIITLSQHIHTNMLDYVPECRKPNCRITENWIPLTMFGHQIRLQCEWHLHLHCSQHAVNTDWNKRPPEE